MLSPPTCISKAPCPFTCSIKTRSSVCPAFPGRQTAEDGVTLHLHYRLFWSRNADGVWSGFHRYLRVVSPTRRQWRWSQGASRLVVATNRRLAAVHTSQAGRSGRVLYQPEKQSWEDFLVSSRIQVSGHYFTVNAVTSAGSAVLFFALVSPSGMALNLAFEPKRRYKIRTVTSSTGAWNIGVKR